MSSYYNYSDQSHGISYNQYIAGWKPFGNEMDTDESVQISEQNEDEEEAELGRSNNFSVPFYLSGYFIHVEDFGAA